ncbi:MAG: hypothetical protein LBQ76_08745 [Candidatus Fibromonas sp.]|jgi:hypothetical protein|nr:hypothetical protein [Candidatus Fibromonas sp.]
MAQKLMTFALMLLFASITANAANTTRYWDSCKPSCAWTGNAGGSPNGAATSCNINGVKLSNSADARNACEGGPSYTCMGQAPWRVNDNMSYGFAASHSNGDCGKCFELTFTSNGEGGTDGGSISGKTMIVMVSNIGGDVGGDQFDLMIPGGGVGQFNALTTQIKDNGGPSNPSLGQTYGGFRAQCGASATCIRSMCDAAFNSAGLADLKAGCYWFIDWFKVANNPTANKREVSCPQALVDAYKNGKGGGGGGSSSNSTASSSSSAPPATYTLTVNRNPTGGGTTTPSPSQSNITTGQQVNITATPGSDYIFQNWTATSGSPTFENNLSATTKVTVYQNTTITANFSTKPTQTWTLTASAYPSGSGTVSPTSQTGTTINISATANTGYTFQGWVVVNGTATFGNASSATTTVTLSANATIRANFTQNSGGGGSSSSGNPPPPGGTGNCITPPGNVAPPNGIETCIIVNGKCYICNPERGQQCSSDWLWSGSQVGEAYWFNEVSCPGGGSSSSKASSSSTGSINWSGVGVLKIEAEDYVSKVGSNMVTITNGDITNIGYIESGYSTTYKVNMTAAGTFPASFSIATGVSSNFTVWVNNTQVGTISKSGTDWSAYSTVNLSSNVSLRQGENTIELRFQSAVNVDYFQLTGTPVSSSSSNPASSSSSRPASSSSMATPVPIILSQTAYSNGAHMQTNGIYLQVMSNAKLELFDLRGNSVKKMNFSSGVYSVQLNDLPKGLYLAKVSFGSERKILRIPLR